MEKYSEMDQYIFRCKKWEPLIAFVAYLIFFIVLLKDFDSGDAQPLKNLITGNFKDIPEFSRIFLMFIIIMLICSLYMILAYVANSRSYIELTNSHLIMNKPVRYPFLNMDTLYIPYEEIENIKMVPIKIGWKVIVRKKDSFGNDTIRFFGLGDGKKFDEELKKRGIKSYISYSGFDMPPDAGD